MVFVFVTTWMLSLSSANAQSTIYFFTQSTSSFGEGYKVDVSVNGKSGFSMLGPLKKTMNSPSTNLSLYVYHAAKRKCIVKDEGKVLFDVNYTFTNRNGMLTNFTAEIQLNLTEGSVHYVNMVPKGLTDVQLKVLSEKEASKLMKDKKYQELPEYIVE